VIPRQGRALLDAIAAPESGGRYDVRFDGTARGATITDFSDHPRILEAIPDGFEAAGKRSSAAGRYQFVKGTWDEAAKAVGAQDFSPINQDKAAWWLAQRDYKARTGRELVADIDAGNLADVRRSLSRTWEGLGRVSDDKFAQAVQGVVMSDALTIDQKRAIAMANARLRLQQQQGNPPPEGMTAQQAAEQAMAGAIEQRNSPEARGRRAYEASPVAAGIASASRGIPFVGEYVDEAAGAIGGTETQQLIRDQRTGFEEANPGLAMGLQVGTGIATGLPMAMAAAPAAMGAAGTSVLGNVARGALMAGVAGGTEGAVSGYGAGDDGNRGESAAMRGAVGASLGGAIGAATPLVARGVSNLVRSARGRPDAAAARAMGGSPESVEVVGRMLANDDPAQAVARIRAAGPDAMVADAGPATAGLLDTAIQRAGPGGRVARDAIEDRAIAAAGDIDGALDRALGRVPPIDPAVSRSVAGKAARVRDELYTRAYAQPIDYSSAQGRNIEALLPRVPGDAINAANKLMQLEGVASRQILADIAEDGTATFRTMPDVRQIDYITRGLNQTAEAGADAGALGGRTPVSRAYKNLSRAIRRELKDAVPEYRTALDRAASDIGIKEARELGEVALRTGTTRGDLAESLMDMGAIEKRKVAQGVRVYVDDLLARVKRTAGSDNTEAREGLKAITELSSRENRDKLRMILGDGPAETLASRIDMAGKAFELRARTADNSRTFARQNMDQAIGELTQPGMIGELLSGSPVTATRRLVQSMSGMTPEARRAVEERITGEIATMLTKPQGAQAISTAKELVRLLARQPATEALAQRIGQAVGLTAGVTGYRAGTQSLSTPR
jgi:muramidase (phage lysozyme)